MSTAPDGKPLRRDAAENRERLLTAAGKVFTDHGLAGGVDEIARVAGVGMGTLYRRFPSKQTLVDELIGGVRRELTAAGDRALDRTDGTGLESVLADAGELLAAQPGCLRQLWAHTAVELDALEQFRAALVVLLSRAQDAGRIRHDVVVSDLPAVLWALSGVMEATGAVAPRAWRRTLEVLIAGMRPAGHGLGQVLTQPPIGAAGLRKLIAGS